VEVAEVAFEVALWVALAEAAQEVVLGVVFWGWRLGLR
jgi:hypothetical protein